MNDDNNQDTHTDGAYRFGCQLPGQAASYRGKLSTVGGSMLTLLLACTPPSVSLDESVRYHRAVHDTGDTDADTDTSLVDSGAGDDTGAGEDTADEQGDDTAVAGDDTGSVVDTGGDVDTGGEDTAGDTGAGDTGIECAETATGFVGLDASCHGGHWTVNVQTDGPSDGMSLFLYTYTATNEGNVTGTWYYDTREGTLTLDGTCCTQVSFDGPSCSEPYYSLSVCIFDSTGSSCLDHADLGPLPGWGGASVQWTGPAAACP